MLSISEAIDKAIQEWAATHGWPKPPKPKVRQTVQARQGEPDEPDEAFMRLAYHHPATDFVRSGGKDTIRGYSMDARFMSKADALDYEAKCNELPYDPFWKP